MLDEHLERSRKLVQRMTLAEKMSQMVHNAPAIDRLGIPAYNWWNEGLHGVARSGVATVFPQAIGLAASFNVPLMHRTATAISDEARAKYNEYRKFGSTEIYQGLTYWSPNINIFRDPRWGRGHETYGEFGFDGYVVSDCGAICDINRFHHLTEDEAESAALAVNHGCTLNCGSAYGSLKAAHLRGLVDEATIAAAVERLFAARFALGMFDTDNPCDAIPYETVDCEEHRSLALQMARESMVLLKNDGILPLTGLIGKMAVIGPNSDERSILLGNYNGWPSRYTTLYEGICDGAPESLRIYKAKGCDLIKDTPGGWAEQPLREALIVGGKSDVIVLCLGLRPDIEGEEGDAYNSDLGGDRRSIDLPSAQLRLFDELAKLGKPIVVVNSSGSAVNLSPLHDRAAAILHVWYPGQAGGFRKSMSGAWRKQNVGVHTCSGSASRHR